jgi:hypothetical protein
LDRTTLVPYETWDDYMATGERFGQFGDDDLPNESLRVAGGFIAPAQMVVGSSVTLKADAYMFGTNVGVASITFQLIESTSLAVPAGSFPDVLHMRCTCVKPGDTQVHDEWWARSVGKIKRAGTPGDGAAVNYELIQFAVPNIANAPKIPLQFQCGAVVVVESSPDLVHWLPIQTNTVSVEGLSLSAPMNGQPAHFFRTRLLP